MKLMTMKQYMKMSKPALIRKITKALRAMPKAKLARLCYNLTKSKLPRLRKIRSKQIGLREYRATRLPELHRAKAIIRKRKTKRRASPKQIAWRKKFAKMSKAGTLRKRRR